MKLKDFSSINLSNLNQRSKLHYLLLASMLFLLFIILLLLYNEIVNERKLKQYFIDLVVSNRKLEDLQKSEKDYIKAQKSLFDYFITNNRTGLDDYFNSLNEVKKRFNFKEDNAFVSSILEKEDAEGLKQYFKLGLVRFIDTLHFDYLKLYELEKSEYNNLKQIVIDDVLLNTSIDSKITVDSVQKKGLIKRIGDAIAGNVDVQVEKEDVIMTMKYGRNITNGNIDDLLKKSMAYAIDNYENKILNLSNRISPLDFKNKKLLRINDSIRKYSNLLFSNYEDTLEKVRDISKTKYNHQHFLNKSIRLTAIAIMIIFLIILSIIVLYLTKRVYIYESQLLKVKDELSANLLFKNKIVSMISHEVRSPLSTIAIYTKQILKREKNKNSIEVFDSINFSINSILLLTTQILEFSKGENKSLQLVYSDFDLSKEIENIIKAFGPLAESKGNKLINLNKIQNPLLVYSDVSKIHQLFYNLLGNAIKYTSNGSITVHCEASEDQYEEVNFKLQIVDTGKGIAKKDLEKVFDLYHQGANRDFDYQNFGIGLGLYLCKEIVDLYHGDIQIESETNYGTKVVISLKMKKSNNLPIS